MTQLFTNNAEATLGAAITTTSQTSIDLATGKGALFPSPTGGDYFLLTLTQAGAESSWEIVCIVGRSTDALTVGIPGSAAANAAGRAYEAGGAAATWAIGDKAQLRLTAGSVVPPAAVGVTVQAYDAQLADIAGLTPTDNGVVIGNGSNFVVESGATLKTSLGLTIGTDVQAYDADTAKLDVAQSWTAEQTFKELKDTVHTITDGAAFEIDPANGSVQVVTLGAARTPAATNFEAGQIVLLGIDDGTAYAITWTSVAPTWVRPGGTATAPTLATSGYTWVLLWKVGTTIYGAEVGKP